MGMTEQEKEEQTQRELQAGIGAFMVALRNWQLAQDEMIEALHNRVSDLETMLKPPPPERPIEVS
jgi:hypothetical protein